MFIYQNTREKLRPRKDMGIQITFQNGEPFGKVRMQLITGLVSLHCWDGDNPMKAEKTFF